MVSVHPVIFNIFFNQKYFLKILQNAFICVLLVALSAQAILATPAATFSQMKVDNGLFCKDLCRYDLSGPGCNVDCSGITPETFDVTPDFCDILCKRGLGKLLT